MAENNKSVEDSSDIEFACGDPKVDIRIGDEYQAEIPPVMSQSERATHRFNPLTDSDFSCSFVVGQPIQVMWMDTKHRDDNVDMNESLISLKTKRSRRGESNGNPSSKQRMNLEAVPQVSSSCWEDLEVDGFVLGLYTFGKNFTQLKKLLGSKDTGEILSFYYGKFYKSAKYKIWSASLKKRRSKCIQGEKLYSGWRLQLLLSRLIPRIPDESQKKRLIEVSKSFAEENTTLENYISAVKELVDLRSLVEAVAIGKEKEDLTVLTTEPLKAKQWFTVSSKVAAGLGAYTSLTAVEIIEKLTGGSRISKARCNDIFWEAVWPRLLARGWHSEQPKDRGYIKSKDHLVFLVPGVKKFSRRKHIKLEHYFDSISDILTKVISEPELLEFETAEIRAPSGFIQENICNQSYQEKHRYLRAPDSSTSVKFTVVDTTNLASGRKLCEFRELRNPNPESLVSLSRACLGDQNSSAGKFKRMSVDVQKRAKFAEESKWERRLIKKMVDEPTTFMIVDTSVHHGGRSSGLRRRRHFPGDENPCKIRKCISREAFADSSKNQSGSNTSVKCEKRKRTDSGLNEEALENVQQGRSKKKCARKSESNNLHSLTSLPLPKRRLLSTCVRKDIKRSDESSVSKPPELNQTTNCCPKLYVDSTNLKTDQSEKSGNGMVWHGEIQERKEPEAKVFVPVSEAVQELGSSVPQQEPHQYNTQCCSKKQGALREFTLSEQQEESNRLSWDKKGSSKYLEIAQQQEKPIKLPPRSASDKNSPLADHGTTHKLVSIEKQEKEHNQQTDTDTPRRQSIRKRPLTTRALEALESGFFTAKSMNCTLKPRKRDKATRTKHSANASNRTQGEGEDGSPVKEDTSSKPLSFLVNKATADQKEDSKVKSEITKRPPIVLKLPLRSWRSINEN